MLDIRFPLLQAGPCIHHERDPTKVGRTSPPTAGATTPSDVRNLLCNQKQHLPISAPARAGRNIRLAYPFAYYTFDASRRFVRERTVSNGKRPQNRHRYSTIPPSNAAYTMGGTNTTISL